MDHSFKSFIIFYFYLVMSYTCNLCGKEFKSKEELVKHLHEEHKDKVKLRKLEHPEASKNIQNP